MDFTQSIVGNAKYAALGNGGVAIDGGLNLDAIDILTTAQNHVLLAVDDIDEAIFVHPRDVAGV
jgi:hypothetical protein